jgi:hypothetical protein
MRPDNTIEWLMKFAKHDVSAIKEMLNGKMPNEIHRGGKQQLTWYGFLVVNNRFGKFPYSPRLCYNYGIV